MRRSSGTGALNLQHTGKTEEAEQLFRNWRTALADALRTLQVRAGATSVARSQGFTDSWAQNQLV